MIRTPKASLCAALVAAADGQIALARDLAWTRLLLDASGQREAYKNGQICDLSNNLLAVNRRHSSDIAANDRSWLRECVKVGLAGIVLGLIAGGVWL